MKKGLQKYSRQRLRFVGTIRRFGSRKTPSGRTKLRTILLVDVYLHKNDEFIAEHVWLTCGRWSKGLIPGDVVILDARVTRYQKGYKGVRVSSKDTLIQDDYKLDKPAFVKLVKPAKNEIGNFPLYGL